MNTKKETYTVAELVYAAVARCPCGAGIAYPRDAEPYGETAYWDCSAILTGTAGEGVKHTDKLPFMFYEIKSEYQPSAHGATTRPVEDDSAKREREIAELRASVANADFLAASFDQKQAALDADRARWQAKRAEAISRLAELGVPA